MMKMKRSFYISAFVGLTATMAATAVWALTTGEIKRLALRSDPVNMTNLVLKKRTSDCSAYTDAYVSSVLDSQQNRTFNAALIITRNMHSCTIVSNGIPNHDFGESERDFATAAAEIAQTFTITRRPRLASETTALTHSRFDAILLNGVVVHMLSAGCYAPSDADANSDGNVLAGCDATDPWLLDPMSEDSPFAEDSHNAHTQPDGMYHYHGNPMALFGDAPTSQGSPLIGFAADGFPIYGSYIRDETGTLRKAESGYTLIEGNRPVIVGSPGGVYSGLYRSDYEFTDAGDLDACNGMTVNGQYAYYVTDSFPWTIGCLSGTPDESFSTE